MRIITILLTLLSLPTLAQPATPPPAHRYLYVATPGVRNYLEHGGHGLLVFDIDDNHKFVKRIPTRGFAPNRDRSQPAAPLTNADVLNVKGICASAATGRLYISTLHTLECIDLKTEQSLWEKPYPGGADRMSITPDGKVIYLPSLERDHWHVVDALTGDVITKITPKSGAHNTIVTLDGRLALLGGLKSRDMTVVDAKLHKPVGKIENFSHFVRPFTTNGKGTLVFVCVNDLLGFEVGDVATGKVLHTVKVENFKRGGVKRHGCPSHGIGMTPDEKELWLCDAANQRMHLFDATQMPPRQIADVKLKDEPGWITFSLDGRYAYPSTGDVVDTKTRQILTTLKDEHGREAQSEKMVEIHRSNDTITRTGDQFGLGRVTH